MIEIRPTTESALSHETYAVIIPGEINPIRPRAEKISIGISGRAIVSTWAQDNTGAQQSIQVQLTLAQYAKLKTIVQHQTVTDWLVFCDGRRYVCTVSIAGAPITIAVGKTEYKQVAINFTVIEDYNT